MPAAGGRRGVRCALRGRRRWHAGPGGGWAGGHPIRRWRCCPAARATSSPANSICRCRADCTRGRSWSRRACCWPGRCAGWMWGGSPRQAAQGPAAISSAGAASGFDAQVNRAVEAGSERQEAPGDGRLLSCLASSPCATSPAPRRSVRVDGHRVSRRMVMLVANNIQLYGIVFRMAPARRDG